MPAPVIGPTGNYGNPRYAGQASVLRRVFAPGSDSHVFMCGDSTGPGLSSAFNRAFLVPVRGFSTVSPSSYLGVPNWFTFARSGQGGYGNDDTVDTVIGLNGNESMGLIAEVKFTTAAISTTPENGQPAGLFNRLYSNNDSPQGVAYRRNFGPGGVTDFLPAGSAMNCRLVVYKNPNGSTGFVRPYVRGTGNAGAYRGTPGLVDFHASSAALAAVDFPFTGVGDEGYILEFQASAEGAAIPDGKNATLASYQFVNPNAHGMLVTDLSFGGSQVADWLSTSRFSANAYNQHLPLLAHGVVPTFVIALNQHNNPSAADFQALKARIRAACPNAEVVWLATESGTDEPGVAKTAELLAATMYDAADLTEDAYLSLADTSLSTAQAGQYVTSNDGSVHNNPAGYTYLATLTRSLAMELMGRPLASDVRSGTTYSIASTGTLVAAADVTAPPAPVVVGANAYPRPTRFEERFRVRLTCADPDAVVYYAFDGAEPYPTLSNRYDGPFYVYRSTQLKAASFRNGLASGIVTAVLFRVDGGVG